MSVKIVFDSIKVGSQRSNAAISVGRVKQNGWLVYSKTNSGFGSVYGPSFIKHPTNYVMDDDLLDVGVVRYRRIEETNPQRHLKNYKKTY